MSENQESRSEYQPLILTGVVAGTLWVLNFLWGLLSSSSGEYGSRFGDSFGVVNSLFSSIAVAGAIYAVILQQKELSLTRQELQGAREAQESAAQAQHDILILQALNSLLTSNHAELAYIQSRLDGMRQEEARHSSSSLRIISGMNMSAKNYYHERQKKIRSSIDNLNSQITKILQKIDPELSDLPTNSSATQE